MEDIKINDNGESDVQLASIGVVIGSDAKGNPIEQNFTKESFEKIAKNLNDTNTEILIDTDHKSIKPGVEKDSTANGWASDFRVEDGKGLFARIKWTDIGRKLIENRCFRWLSPVFKLNDKKEPVELVNAALTNMPAQKSLNPIINSAPIDIQEESNKKETIIMNITKEELVQLIKDVISDQNNTNLPTPETKEEVKEDIKEETKEEVNEDVKEEKVDEESKSETSENSCSVTSKNEEVKEEVKEEIKPEEKKEEEVIKIEVLNSACSSTLGVSVKEEEPWKQLTGKDFWDWLEKHPNGI